MLSESMATAATGTAFGAALAASGVYMPSVIIDQFRLTDFHMFHLFATAMGSSAQVGPVPSRYKGCIAGPSERLD